MYRLIVLLLLPALAFTQEEKTYATEEETRAVFDAVPRVENQYEYSEIIQMDSSHTKDILYRNAKLFFAYISKSSKDVLQYDERNEGKIIGKVTFQVKDHQNVLLSSFDEVRTTTFTLEISCKDGRYRYRMFGFAFEYSYGESDKRKAERFTTGTLNFDEAFERTGKGSTKKMERNLFVNTVNEIKSTQNQLKEFMRRPSSKDEF